jgi:hypothetical protein
MFMLHEHGMDVGHGHKHEHTQGDGRRNGQGHSTMWMSDIGYTYVGKNFNPIDDKSRTVPKKIYGEGRK